MAAMYARQLISPKHVVTAGGTANLHVHLIGPHPILLHFLGRMTFMRIVRNCLPKQRQAALDHAQCLALLIQNILLSPGPLYRLKDWADPIDPQALNLAPSEKRAINDDQVARSLDALVTPHARNLFFRLALHIIKHFELDTRRIHHDTTTVTVHGQYKTSHQTPKITYGMNKDHRPDLKQLVFGLNVTADGAVPISHDIYSGNQTDDTLHIGNIDRLRLILSQDDFVYVADSKLCTKKNLAHIADYGGTFVTVLPRTRAEDQCFRKTLRTVASVRWRKLWVQENSRQPNTSDVYWTTADGPQKTQDGYRIVWLKSSIKAALDAESRQQMLRTVEVDLVQLRARLNRGKLKKRAAIRKATIALLKQHRCERFFTVQVTSRVHIRLKHLRPGRPRPEDALREIRTVTYDFNITRDPTALLQEARTDGVFTLLTNLKAAQVAKKEVLRIYKYQPYVEKRHALLKSELQVAPVYIKKPQRVAGLIHAHFLAMTVDALIERTVRSAMQRERIETLPILPEGRPTKTPTTARILEMFSNVSWYEFERGGEIVVFPIQLSPLQKQLLRLLDIDCSVYA